MLAAICQNPEVLTISKYVRLVINLIRIIVPIALMISLMVTFINAMTGKGDDELPKALKQSVNKILAAILVFLIPTFINTIMSTMNATSINYKDCLDNATEENISAAYTARAKKYVERANDSLLRGDYNIAISYVNKLENEEAKKELSTQLTKVEEKVKEREEKDQRKMGGYIGEGYVYPLADYKATTTTCFAVVDSLHPYGHSGLDLAAAGGTPIYAAKDGKVVTSITSVTTGCGSCSSLGCGNYVVIQHDDGIKTKYCHMQYGSVLVKKGDMVSQGQQIGSVGTTGHSTGNHLHFTVTKDGVNIDPANLLVYNAYDAKGCGLRTK